mmetsp:Transcript_3323/g.4887  ORF Transcript_3323/g.4887 Transcript_3323/m.4887 type:complete len:163 (+) Transcript_3323:1595-2083(+)
MSDLASNNCINPSSASTTSGVGSSSDSNFSQLYINAHQDKQQFYALKALLIQQLSETGELQSLRASIQKHCEHNGWRASQKSNASQIMKEYIARDQIEQITMDVLSDRLTRKGRKLISPPLKQKLHSSIDQLISQYCQVESENDCSLPSYPEFLSPPSSPTS